MKPNDDARTLAAELESARDRDKALMLVGHLPHLARLAGWLLSGDADRQPVRFVNAGVVRISPDPHGWAVVWHLPPACVR